MKVFFLFLCFDFSPFPFPFAADWQKPTDMQQINNCFSKKWVKLLQNIANLCTLVVPCSGCLWDYYAMSIESKLRSAKSKLKSVESRLKSIERKLKSIESKLKSVESKLKSIEISWKSSEFNWKSIESIWSQLKINSNQLIAFYSGPGT